MTEGHFPPPPGYRQRLLGRGYSLWPTGENDWEVAGEIFAASRREELAGVGWSAAEQEAFLRQQHTIQNQTYRQNYPGAWLDLVVRGGVTLGRLYVHEWKEELRIMDIALLPPYRDQGHGGALLNAVLECAGELKWRVSLMVEHNNPAQHLYQRLGFQPEDATHGVYRTWGWTPSG